MTTANDRTDWTGYMASAIPRQVQWLLAESDSMIKDMKYAAKVGRALNEVC